MTNLTKASAFTGFQMAIEPELLQQLLATFRAELEDRLHLISDGLLQLEQGPDELERQKNLNSIFRAAHNIKSALRGLDLTDLTEIDLYAYEITGANK